jgi:hypothetical protein
MLSKQVYFHGNVSNVSAASQETPVRRLRPRDATDARWLPGWGAQGIVGGPSCSKTMIRSQVLEVHAAGRCSAAGR